jgi:hypothetical protein
LAHPLPRRAGAVHIIRWASLVSDATRLVAFV